MLFLLCVFVALAAADSVQVLNLNSGSPQFMASPWTVGSGAVNTNALHVYSNQPTEFFTLPYRYGFIARGSWVRFVPGAAPAVFPSSYQAPNTAWLRLCDAVPVQNDDYPLLIQAFGGSGCATQCIPPNFAWTIEALLPDGINTKTVATPSVVRDGTGACTAARMTVNLATLRKANPGSALFLKVVNAWGVAERPQGAPAPQVCLNDVVCPVGTVCVRTAYAGYTAGQCAPKGVANLCTSTADCGAGSNFCAPFAPLAGTTVCTNACTNDFQCADRAFYTTPTSPAQTGLKCTGTCGGLTYGYSSYDNFEFRFQRVGTAWTEITTCDYSPSSNLVLAECKAIAGNLVACSDGSYDANNEECDIGLDPVGCSPSCLCLQPRVPDGTGKCSFCGNGAIEQLQGEKCDRGTDANCSTDCKGCMAGFALNAAGKCTTCGNGIAESGEACDYVLDPVRCSATCSCPDGYVGNGRGSCTQCGNGVLDQGEVCDNKFPNCNTECTGCTAPYVPRSLLADNTGACTLCGNGVLDDGEECDWKNDVNCDADCQGCKPFHNIINGVCSRCGNGYLDAGEKCDSLRENCARDCQSCVNGRTPANDKWGNCGGCGNGVIDSDEVCDTGIDGAKCASDCGSCMHPYTSVGRRCVTCGNGKLDTVRDADGTILFVEVCDAAQPGCRSDCAGCEAGWDASGQADGTCVPQCDACCSALAERTGATDDEVASASTMAFSLVFFGLLAALL